MKATGFRAAAAALLLSGASILGVLRWERSLPGSAEWVIPSTSGDWIAAGAPAQFWRAGRRVFFMDPSTGKFFRGSRVSAGHGVPVLSPDGRTAAWTRSGFTLRGETESLAHILQFDSEGTARNEWDAAPLHEPPLIVFSDDGSRIALVTAERVSVRDLKSGRLAGEGRPRQPLWLWGSRGFTTATFFSRGVLRIYCLRPSESPPRETGLDILEFDVDRGRLSRIGRAAPLERVFPILADAARERLLVRGASAKLALLDARSGRPLREFAGGKATSRVADFLSDGRIALFESELGHVRLDLLDRTGSLERSIDLGAGERAFLAGEAAPGTLDVAVAFAANLRRRDARVLRVDLASGSSRPIADHVFPVATYARWTCGDPGRVFPPGAEATRLYYGSNGSLLELEGPNRLRAVLGTRTAR